MGWAGRSPGLRWLTTRRVVWLLALLLASLAGLVLRRHLRHKSRREMGDGPRVRQRHPVAARYQRLLRLLARHGHAKPPANTPREFARALRSAGTAGATIVGEMTEVYYRARYGQPSPGDEELAQLEALLDRLKHELVRKPRASAEE